MYAHSSIGSAITFMQPSLDRLVPLSLDLAGSAKSSSWSLSLRLMGSTTLVWRFILAMRW